ncbi:MAG TPA: mechanosensitive ion channel domain-containing protein [Dehalococcoidia bacterium]|nr:mechanosensitive ion channel domain-containing protein [Dehalococcoidia bacterium]
MPVLSLVEGPFLVASWDEIETWLEHSGTQILIIAALLAAAYLLFRSVVLRVIRAALLRGVTRPDAELRRRLDTLLAVIDRTAGLVALLLAVVTILPEAGVNITAIVTGLGITGLALALGAQALVRDGINGIFLLAEDQYRKGDVVRLADVMGTVEDITLRRTILRDEDGVVHSVPNGAISVVSNYTRDFARVNLEVRVAYGEDLSRVAAIVERVGKELAADSHFKRLISEAPKALRIASVGDAGVALTVSARTQAAARWEVASELRRRLTEAFVSEGVRVPFPPHAVVPAS